MAIYEVTGPDGKTYELEGPSGATKEQIIGVLQHKLANPVLDVSGPREPAGLFENIGTGLGAGAVGLLESAALGGATMLGEENETATRDVIQSIAEKVRPSGGNPEDISYKLSQGVGSMAAFLPTALLGPGALPAAGALAMGAGAGEASERARAQGVDEATRTSSALKGAGIGTLDVLPLGKPISQLAKFSKIGGPKILADITKKLGSSKAQGLVQRVRSAAATGGMEAAQEMTTQSLQNLVEQGYNPDREIIEGLGEAGGVGFGSGAIVQILTDMIVRGPRRGGIPDTPDTPDSESGQREMFPAGEVTPQPQMDMFPETNPVVPPSTPPTERRAPTQKQEQQDMFAQQLGLLDGIDTQRDSEYYADQKLPNNAKPRTQGDLFDGRGAVLPQGRPETPRPLARVAGAEADVGRRAQAKAAGQMDISEEISLNRMQDAEGIRAKRAEDTERTRAQQLETLKARSSQESLDNQRVADRKKTTQQKRAKVLSQVIEDNQRFKISDPAIVANDYSKALAEYKFGDTKPTKQEVAAITKALDVQFAQPAKKDIPNAPRVDTPTQNAPMESAIAPKARAAQPAGQLSFEGMGRSKLRAPATPEQNVVAGPRVIDDVFLNKLGIGKKNPVRDTVRGKDLNKPDELKQVQGYLGLYAASNRVPKKARESIPALFAGLTGEQIPMLGPRGGITPEAGGKRGKPRVQQQQAKQPESVPTGTGVSDTGKSVSELPAAPIAAPDTTGTTGTDGAGLAAPVSDTKPAKSGAAKQPDTLKFTPEAETLMKADELDITPAELKKAKVKGTGDGGVFTAEDATEYAKKREERLEVREKVQKRKAEKAAPKETAEKTEAPAKEETPAKPVAKKEAAPAPEETPTDVDTAEDTVTTDNELPAKAKSKGRTATQKKKDSKYPDGVKFEDTLGKRPLDNTELIASKLTAKDIAVMDTVRDMKMPNQSPIRADFFKDPADRADATAMWNQQRAAKTYLEKYPDSPASALYHAIFDSVSMEKRKREGSRKESAEDKADLLTIPPKVASFYAGTSKETADAFLKWADSHLSEGVLPAIEKHLETVELSLRPIDSYTQQDSVEKRQKKLAKKQNLLDRLLTDVGKLRDRENNVSDTKALEKLFEAAEKLEDGKLGQVTDKKLETLVVEAERVLKDLRDRANEMTTAFDDASDIADASDITDITDTLHELYLLKSAVESLDNPLHPDVVASLEAGKLEDALKGLSESAGNKDVAQLAKKFAELVGTTKVKVEDTVTNESGKEVAGAFDPATNTITLNRELANSPHVVTHEVAHALTSETLANKSHPLTKQLTEIYEDVKDRLSSHYGSQSVDEFVAEAFTNPEFQTELASIFNESESAWRRVVRAITNFIRNKLGMSKVNGKAYNEFNMMIEGLLAPAPDSRFAGELYMEDVDGKPSALGATYNAVYNKAAGSDSDFIRKVTGLLTSGAPIATRWALFKALPSQALSDVIGHYSPAAGKIALAIHKLYMKLDGDLNLGRNGLDSTLKGMRDFDKKFPEKMKVFHELTSESSFEQYLPASALDSRPKDQAVMREKYKYANESERKKYDLIKQQWAEVGSEGQELYWELLDTYEKQYKEIFDVLYNRLDSIIDADGTDADTKKSTKKLQDTLTNELLKGETIFPYFPFTRAGGSKWLSYTMKGSAEPNIVSFVDVIDRDNAIIKLRGDSAVDQDSIDPFDRIQQFKVQNMPSRSFVAETIKILKASGKQNGEEVEQIMRLFVSMLPETAYAKSMQPRENTLGFTRNAMVAFQRRAYDLQGQIASIQGANDLYAKLDELEKQLDEEVSNDSMPSELRNLIYKEMAVRVNFAVNPPQGAAAKATRMANRAAFIGTLGFNISSAAVNLTQLPMVVFPYLGGRTTYSTAFKAMTAASKIYAAAPWSHNASNRLGTANREVKTMGKSMQNLYDMDEKGKHTIPAQNEALLSTEKGFYTYADGRSVSQLQLAKDLIPLMDVMTALGMNNTSLLYETLGGEQSGKMAGGKLQEAIDKGTAASAYIFHNGERFNRQVAVVGAYLNELQYLDTKGTAEQKAWSPKQKRDYAIEHAIYTAQQTNGGASLNTTSRMSQENILRVAMMYKTFGVQMNYHQLKMLRYMYKDKSPQERHEAMKQYVGTQVMVVSLAGLSGLTAMGIIESIYNMQREDDEPDAQTLFREYLGDLAYKGGVNKATTLLGGEGADVSARIGLSNLIMQSNRYNFDPSVEKSIVTNLGGPFYGVVTAMGRGFNEMMEATNSREFQRGFEGSLPAAFRNVMKAIRFANDGANTRRGDPIMGDIDGGLIAAQAMGFAPAEYVRNQESNMVLKRIDKKVNEDRSKLLRRYYLSLRLGGASESNDVWKDVSEFNKKWPQFRIDAKAVKASIKQHRKTTQTMYNGVLFSPSMRNYLESLGADWNQ